MSCNNSLLFYANGNDEIKDSSTIDCNSILKVINDEKHETYPKKTQEPNLEINNLSLREINDIIKINILCGKYENKINEIREIIENKLDITFYENTNSNRYIINDWCSNYLYFNFVPLFLLLIQKIILIGLHII
jgi:uncharacterized membrane protein